MRVLDLFSGIGGLSLGLERAGMRTVAFCEIDAYCRAILGYHWPALPIYRDVRELTADRLAADGVPPRNSSAAASPVRTSAWQEGAPVLLAGDRDYGSSSPDSLASYDPQSRSWKTPQACLVSGWTTFSVTWPRSGMTRSGTAFRLPPLVRITLETECGLLPTPAARDYKGSLGRNKLMERQAMTRGVCLEEYLLRRLLPTPCAGNSHSVGRLDEWGGLNTFRGTDIGRLHLNPSFVEEHMGYPTGWTAYVPSAMPSFHRSRKSSAARS